MGGWMDWWMDGGWSPFPLPHSHVLSSVMLRPHYSGHRILGGWSLRDHCPRCYTSDLGKTITTTTAKKGQPSKVCDRRQSICTQNTLEGKHAKRVPICLFATSLTCRLKSLDARDTWGVPRIRSRWGAGCTLVQLLGVNC